MNVFDDETELALQCDCELVCLLAMAGLTVAEVRAWRALQEVSPWIS